MVEATPLEKYLAGLDVKLLESSINDPLLICTTTVRCEIIGYRMVNLDESGGFIDDVKLVLVCQTMVSSSQFSDCLIMLV